MSDVYLKDGNKAVFHGESGSQYIVEIYEELHNHWNDEWEVELSGRKIFVDEVYSSPPRDVIDEGILAAKKELSEINSLIRSQKDEVRDLNINIHDLKEELDAIEPLKNVFDFIRGDFKYYALPDLYKGPQISKKNIADSDEGQYERGTKLLTLFGKSNGDVEWRLSQYSDGSGSSKVAIPCKTIEDAKKVMSEHIYKELEGRAKIKRFYAGGMHEWMLSNGCEMPSDWVKGHNEYVAENKAKSITRLQGEISKSQAALKELEAE